MQENFTVYIHITPNNKRYIGITSRTVQKRWLNGRGYKNNVYFYKAIQKYGWDNIKHIIIKQNLNKQEAVFLEQQLIESYKSNNPQFGYNITKGGFGRLGDKVSEETRQKISQASKQHWQDPNFRKKVMEGIKNNPYKMSNELKAQISKSMSITWHNNEQEYLKRLEKAWETNRGKDPWNKGKKGFKHTEETKQKISNNSKGRKLSDETKRKIGEKSKGRKMSEENRLKLIERNKNMSEETRQKISQSLKNRWKEGAFTNAKTFKKGDTPWNKGQTKETNEKLKIMSENKKGKKPSEQQIQAFTQRMKDYYKTNNVWNKTKVECVETGVQYNSIKEACEATGFTTIQYAIKHGSATKGYHWRKIDE